MTTPAAWASPAWLDAASIFIDETLRANGHELTGPVTLSRIRPWAALLEAPSTSGRVWLKAACPRTAFEVALYRPLHAIVPDQVLAPLGLDDERGWLVLPDGGSLLGQSYKGDALASALELIMPRYAELQLKLMPHTATLVSLGVTDMTPAVMPSRFEEGLAVGRKYLKRAGSPVEWQEFTAVAALGPRFAQWCAELAQAPGAPSLDHNDLHPWNVFAASKPDTARFFDWGDSVIAHPFASLLVLLPTLQHALETGPDDPRVLRVRDAYLEPFTHLASHRELLETATLARRVAKAARVLTWQRAIGDAPPDDYAAVPFGKLLALLEEDY